MNKKLLVPVLALGIAFSITGCKKGDSGGTGSGSGIGKAEVLDCYITGDKTLTDHNANGVDYIIKCDFEVQNAVLTINEGVTIQVETDHEFLVNDKATIVVNGTSAKPVSIQGKSAGPSWKGLKIMSKDPRNKLNYLHISNTGSSDNFYVSAAGFSLSSKIAIAVMGSSSITNTTIDDCAGIGIAFGDEATITALSANTFRSCKSYPLLMYAGLLNNNISFANSAFANNAENYIALYSLTSNAEVYEPVIINEAPIPYLAVKSLTFLKSAVFNQGVTMVMDRLTTLAGYEVDASLTMNGTATKPITIRGKVSSAGFWNGLCVTRKAVGSLNYVHLSDGGGDFTATSAPFKANYNVGDYEEASLTLNNCTSANSGSTCDVGVSRTSNFVNTSPAIASVCVEP